jgi:hypothetical protein
MASSRGVMTANGTGSAGKAMPMMISRSGEAASADDAYEKTKTRVGPGAGVGVKGDDGAIPWWWDVLCAAKGGFSLLSKVRSFRGEDWGVHRDVGPWCSIFICLRRWIFRLWRCARRSDCLGFTTRRVRFCSLWSARQVANARPNRFH